VYVEWTQVHGHWIERSLHVTVYWV
jgi:hypothetical protein